jgi:hypothetical protein
MIGFRRTCFLFIFAASLALCASARAEGIFTVNDPGSGNWVFDQPSVEANGTVLHMAFVGDNTSGADTASLATLNTRLFYAAVNGGADFSNKLTTREQVRLTPPVAIDNGDAYFSARHPQIALRSATEVVILFQARLAPGPTGDYKLFRARVGIANNAVTFQHVDRILNPSGAEIPNSLTDPSFGLVTADNTLRVAFSSTPSSFPTASPSSDVYYARVAVDNARVAGNTLILLSRTPSSTGSKPLPRLRLDSNNYSHIVWAANDSTQDTPSGIYYAMMKAVAPSVVDNLAIGATPVLSGTSRWGFPNVILANPSNYLWIVAGNEPFGSTASAGSLGVSQINPYAVTHDGNPVNVTNVGANSLFFLNPPGEAVLSTDFDAYHPEAWIDGQFRLHVAGYGYRNPVSPYRGTPGRYYSMFLGNSSSSAGVSSIFATMLSSPVSLGLQDNAFAMQIAEDYTRPAFFHFSGKAVHFWSGPDNVLAGDTTARNLYVTSVIDSPDNPPVTQSGCSMVEEPRRGEADRIPGAALLLLPAFVLALRRVARKAFVR